MSVSFTNETFEAFNNKAPYVRAFNFNFDAENFLKFIQLINNHPSLSTLHIKRRKRAIVDLKSRKGARVHLKNLKLTGSQSEVLFKTLAQHRGLTSLSIIDHGLSDTKASYVSDYIISFDKEDNASLKKLDLSKNKFSDDSAEAVGKALSENKSIIYLDLSKNNFSAKGLVQILQFINRNQTLQKLYLSSRKPKIPKGSYHRLPGIRHSNSSDQDSQDESAFEDSPTSSRRSRVKEKVKSAGEGSYRRLPGIRHSNSSDQDSQDESAFEDSPTSSRRSRLKEKVKSASGRKGSSPELSVLASDKEGASSLSSSLSVLSEVKKQDGHKSKHRRLAARVRSGSGRKSSLANSENIETLETASSGALPRTPSASPFINLTHLYADYINLEKRIDEFSDRIKFCHKLMEISLQGCSLTAGRSIKTLSSALTDCKWLHKVDLSENQFGDTGLREVTELVKRNPNLFALRLRDCGIGKSGLEILRDVFNSVTTPLKVLDLSENTLTDGATLLTEGLTHQRIWRLTLTKCGLNQKDLNEIATFLEDVSSKELSHLTLASNKFSSIVFFASHLASNKSIELLDISNNKIEISDEIIQILKANYVVTVILADKSKKGLAECLVRNRRHANELMAACKDDKSDLDVRALIEKGVALNTSDPEGNTALHHAATSNRADFAGLLLEHKIQLKLNNALRSPADLCSEGSEIFKAIRESERLHPAYQGDLHKSRIATYQELSPTQDLKSVLQAIKTDRNIIFRNRILTLELFNKIIEKALKNKLQVRKIDFSFAKLNNDMLQILADQVENFKYIETIILQGNSFSFQKLAEFLDRLRSLKHLRKLSLSDNELKPVSIEEITSVLKKNKNFCILELDRVFFQEKRDANFFNSLYALVRELSLVKLSLQGNHINRDTARGLLATLKENSHIVRLDFSENDFNTPEESNLIETLEPEANPYLVYLDLPDCKRPKLIQSNHKILTDFFEACQTVNIPKIQKLLSENPSCNHYFDEDSNTALHLAVSSLNIELVRCLLAFKPVIILNSQDKTPMDILHDLASSAKGDEEDNKRKITAIQDLFSTYTKVPKKVPVRPSREGQV